MRMRLPYAGQQTDPVYPRHPNIGDHQIRRLVRNQLKRLLAVSGGDHAVSLLFQEYGEELAHRLFVIDDQYRVHYSANTSCCAGRSVPDACLSKTLKVDPPPSRLVTSIRPPRLSMIFRVMLSPRPVPPGFVV